MWHAIEVRVAQERDLSSVVRDLNEVAFDVADNLASSEDDEPQDWGKRRLLRDVEVEILGQFFPESNVGDCSRGPDSPYRTGRTLIL